MSRKRKKWIVQAFRELCRKEPRCLSRWKLKEQERQRESAATVSHVVRLLQAMSSYVHTHFPGSYPSWRPSEAYFSKLECAAFRHRLQVVEQEVAIWGLAGLIESQFSRLVLPLLLELPEDMALASRAAASFFRKHRIVKAFKEVALRAKAFNPRGPRSQYETLTLALCGDNLVPVAGGGWEHRQRRSEKVRLGRVLAFPVPRSLSSNDLLPGTRRTSSDFSSRTRTRCKLCNFRECRQNWCAGRDGCGLVHALHT